MHVADLPDVPEALVFATRNGTALDVDNLCSRTIKRLMQEAGAPWAAFHTLRHTFASLQLAGGANLVQLSRALRHHSAAFTLDVYTHLLDGEEPPRSTSPWPWRQRSVRTSREMTGVSGPRSVLGRDAPVASGSGPDSVMT